MKYRNGKILKRLEKERLKRLGRLKKGNNLDPLIGTEANKREGVGKVSNSHHRKVNKVYKTSIERLDLKRKRLNLTASIKEYKGNKLNEAASFEFQKNSKGHNSVTYNSKVMTYNTFLSKAKVDTEIASFIRFLQASMIKDGYKKTDLLKYLADRYSGNDSKTDVLKTDGGGNAKFKPTPDSPEYLKRKEEERKEKAREERDIKKENANRNRPSIRGYATNLRNKPTGDPHKFRSSSKNGIYSKK